MSKRATVLGVLSIVFGLLTVSYTLLNLLVFQSFMRSLTAFGPTDAQQVPFLAAANELVDAQRPLMVAMGVPFVVMSIALTVVGVGLYRRRAWGRAGAVAWAWLALLVLVGIIVANVVWLHPEMTRLSAEIYAKHHVQAPVSSEATQLLGTVGTFCFYAPFPLVLLALLAPKRNAALFS